MAARLPQKPKIDGCASPEPLASRRRIRLWDRLYDILLSTDLCSRLRFPFQADTVPAWVMTVR